MSEPRFLASSARVYRNTGTIGSATPTWVRWSKRQRVSLQRGSEFADVSAEDSEGWKDEQPIQKTLAGEIESFIGKDPEDDATYIAVVEAWQDNEPIEIAICFGDITTPGRKYLRCPVYVTLNEDLDEKNPVKYKAGFRKAPGNPPTFETVED